MHSTYIFYLKVSEVLQLR